MSKLRETKREKQGRKKINEKEKINKRIFAIETFLIKVEIKKAKKIIATEKRKNKVKVTPKSVLLKNSKPKAIPKEQVTMELKITIMTFTNSRLVQ